VFLGDKRLDVRVNLVVSHCSSFPSRHPRRRSTTRS